MGMLVVGLGVAGVPLDTSVNIAFPAITAAFALEVRTIQWVVICYVLTYTSLMLVFGKVGDLLGYRRVFQLGLLVSAMAFVLCALAPTFGWLLVFRTLQGIGAVGSIAGKIALAPPPHPMPTRLAVDVAIDRARNALTQRIAEVGGGQGGAVAAALVTGKRGLITEATNNDLRAAGIYHIVMCDWVCRQPVNPS